MAGSFGDIRDSEQLGRLDKEIGDFEQAWSSNHAPGKQALFLFPAGMGSELMRSFVDYRLNVQAYYLSWASLALLAGGAIDLQIAADDSDLQQRVVVADGEVDFNFVCMQWSPYQRFRQWCLDNNIHLFVFGWDWRRGVAHSTDLFLNKFLPRFEASFPNDENHPLENFTIIGHSAGGMVVKTIANQHANAYVQLMKRAITVGSPFYGYGEQIRRFLRGQAELNDTVPGRAKQIAQICATMLGGYEFLYMDGATYDANAAAFNAPAEEFKLASYPCVDSVDSSRADPFDVANAALRYPMTYGFNTGLLAKALVGSKAVSADLAPAVSDKFYCVRGVQMANGQPVNGTPVGVRWARVAANYDPDNPAFPDTVTDVLGPGDGTQQAWGARLLRLPSNHVVTVKNGTLEHSMLMEDDDVQAAIGAILLQQAPVACTAPQHPAPATQQEMRRFFKTVYNHVIIKLPTPRERRRALVNLLRKYENQQLKAILIRAYRNLQQSQQSSQQQPAGGKPPRGPRRSGRN